MWDRNKQLLAVWGLKKDWRSSLLFKFTLCCVERRRICWKVETQLLPTLLLGLVWAQRGLTTELQETTPETLSRSYAAIVMFIVLPLPCFRPSRIVWLFALFSPVSLCHCYYPSVDAPSSQSLRNDKSQARFLLIMLWSSVRRGLYCLYWGVYVECSSTLSSLVCSVNLWMADCSRPVHDFVLPRTSL